MPTRLPFDRDDWILIEWSCKCIERAAARADNDEDTSRHLTAFRRALLRLPFVHNEYFDFSVSRPEPNECSFCIALSEDGFSLDRIEWVGSGAARDHALTTDFRVDANGREGENPYDLEEWFSMLAQFIDEPEYEILLDGEADRTAPSVPDLAGAKVAWDKAFE